MDMKNIAKPTPSIQTLPKSTQADHHVTDLASHTTVIKSHPEAGTESTPVTTKKQPAMTGSVKITDGYASTSGGATSKTALDTKAKIAGSGKASTTSK